MQNTPMECPKKTLIKQEASNKNEQIHFPKEEELDKEFKFASDQFFLKTDENEIQLDKFIEELNMTEENKNIDIYIKDFIKDLEDFTYIVNFDDLIIDYFYTYKLLIKSIEKIINFKYFYTKFIIPKKNIQKEDEDKIKSKNGNEKNEINEVKQEGISTYEEEQIIDKSEIHNQGNASDKNEHDKIKFNENNKKEDKNEENGSINKERKKDINEINEENKENIKYKCRGKQKSILEKTKDIFKKSENIIKENKEKNENKKGKNKTRKDKDKDKAKKKKTDNKKNFNEYKKYFFSKVSEKTNILNKKDDSKQLEEENIISEDKTDLLGINSQITQSNSNQQNETQQKIEEYQIMHYQNVLSIINNKANIEEEDLVEGKSYESKVRKYFRMILEMSSEKSYVVNSNPSQSIQGFYKFYENTIENDKNKEIKNIFGNSKVSPEYNKLEFDVIVDNIDYKVIQKIIEIYKSSIIAKQFEESEGSSFQIIGEVAKNILVQSIDKLKQIKKIIDILLIDKFLNNDIINESNPFLNEFISDYCNLKLNIKKKKMIFLFSDGSFLELKKAILFNEEEIKNVSGDYDKVNINSIFPLVNKRRYLKNAIYLKKIIECLNNSGIPYIIFYIGDEVNNKVERTIINHIKNSNNDKRYKSLISKIEKNESLISKNISQSFIIKTIKQKLKQLNKNEIFDIIKSIISEIPYETIITYYKLLFNIIEKKNVEMNNKYKILIVLISQNIYSVYTQIIDSLNQNNSFTYIHFIQTTKQDLLNKIKKYKDLKTYKTFVFTDEKEILVDNMLKYSLEAEIKSTSEIENYILIKEIGKKRKELLQNYILPHYAHFNEEGYLNTKNLHKKIIYDLKNLGNIFPIKVKENKIDDNMLIKNAKDCIFHENYKNIIDKKVGEILGKIQNCIPIKLYDHLIIKKEKDIRLSITNYLIKISEHIACFDIYEKFFMKYLINNMII